MRRALLAVVALGVARAFTTKRAVTRPRGVASMSATAAALVIGVDVGSGSARRSGACVWRDHLHQVATSPSVRLGNGVCVRA